MRINSNISSLFAWRALAQTSKALSRSLERLATGKRINRAGDDAAGLAISSGLEAQQRGMLQAIRNMNDAQGFLTVAEGTIAAQTDIVLRMRELAMQSANGTLSSQDRSYLNSELQELYKEYNRLTSQTNFNGANLLDGSFSTTRLQVGARASESIEFNLSNTRAAEVFTETKGTGNFTVASTYSAPNSSSFGVNVKMADLNGDGINDILQSAYQNSNINIRLGMGDGTFYSVQTLSTAGLGGWYSDMEVGDFNNDDKVDLIQAGIGSNYLLIALGNGNGTFGAVRTFESGATSSGNVHVAIGDLNKDGNLDAFIANRFDPTVAVVFGDGVGGFSSPTTFSSGTYGASAEIFDVNNDHNLDLIFADTGGNHFVKLGNGDGTFRSTQTRSSGYNGWRLGLADVTGDGIIDMITKGAYFRGNGDGSFQAAIAISGMNTSADFEMVDVNSDDHLDIAQAHEGILYIILSNGNGTFSGVMTTQYSAATSGGDFSYEISTGDVDGDGVADIAMGTPGSSTMTVLRNGTYTGSAISRIDVRTQAKAQKLLSILDTALGNLNSARSNIGATSNRLEYAKNSSALLAENLAVANSQIMDTDVAMETAELTRQQILQKAGVAVLGQANLQMQMVLSLLNS